MGAPVLLFEHYISPSPIHGLGVFTACPIPAGAKVWEFHPAVDFLAPRASLTGLPEHILRLYAMRTEYVVDQDAYLWGLDGDQFMNHSDNSNVKKEGFELYARCDIAIGEELTCDYRETLVPAFDPDTGLPHRGHFSE